MNILITGGAGFVGSQLARSFRENNPTATMTILDNLKRRGAELNVPVLQQLGMNFVHGDIRTPADLDDLPGNFDLMIEASAEPSVKAGLDGSPNYVLQTNLVGTLNCLEFARKRVGGVVFLSTSRVYSIAPLRAIRLRETETRFAIEEHQEILGVSSAGIAENFPVHEPRSLYGASKLASELIIQEYVDTYGLKAVINRCGVIAGPGQFGKVDQGVFTLWVAHHYFGKPLRYTGFGGTGKQVRDLLHPLDLYDLVARQVVSFDNVTGRIFNVGGGVTVSTSLQELTTLCEQVTGNTVAMSHDTTTSPVDIPLYISDCRKVGETFDWQPQRRVADIVHEIAAWLRENETQLRPLFAPA
jgi:CDP-paratose 2-epimerase